MGLESHYTSTNLGGVKRGDSEETGDLEARPTEKADRGGSGVRGGGGGAEGHITGDASALGESRSQVDLETPLSSGDTDLDDLHVAEATDPSLGLTGIPGRPAEDWAADTGPTQSGESAAPSRRR